MLIALANVRSVENSGRGLGVPLLLLLTQGTHSTNQQIVLATSGHLTRLPPGCARTHSSPFDISIFSDNLGLYHSAELSED
jgi:hypothetical protein